MFRRRPTFREVVCLLLLIVLPAAGARIRANPSASGSSASARPVADEMQHIDALLRAGQRSEALVRMDALRARGGLTPQQTFALAWLYGRLGRFQTALTMFLSLPAGQPSAGDRDYAIALCQFNLKRYDAAIQTLRSMQQRGIAGRDAVHLLAVIYDQTGQPGQAYAVLRADLLQHPTDLNGYLNLITLCVNHHSYELALKIATRGLEKLPDSYELYSSRAAVLDMEGKRPEAMADYRAAIQRQPKRPDDYFSLALIQYHQGDYAAASRTLDTAIEAGIADSDIHYLLAECIRAQHGSIASAGASAGASTGASAIASAMEQVTEALLLDPSSAPALTLRGQLELQQGDTPAAIRDLERARTLAPSSNEVAYHLARAYQKAGRRQDAQRLFQKVQEKNQDLNTALQHKKMIQILVERPAEP